MNAKTPQGKHAAGAKKEDTVAEKDAAATSSKDVSEEATQVLPKVDATVPLAPVTQTAAPQPAEPAAQPAATQPAATATQPATPTPLTAAQQAQITQMLPPQTAASQAPAQQTPATQTPTATPQAATPTPNLSSLPPISADMSGFDADGDVMRALNANSSGQATGFVQAGFDLPQQRKRGAAKVFGIVIGTILVLLVAAYGAGFAFFSSHFPPNTTIGEVDASMKTVEEVEAALEAKAAEYTLTIKGGDFSYSTDAESIGYTVDAPAIAKAVQAELDPATWPLLLIQGKHDEAGKYTTHYDQEALKADLKKAVKEYNKDAVAPVDASIEYDETSNSFKIKPEELGTKYGVKKVLKAAYAAVDAMEESVVLGEDMLAQPKLTSTDEKIVEAAEQATKMIDTNIEFELDDYDLGSIGSDQLAEFVTINDDNEADLDEEALGEYIDALIGGFNTVGAERSFKRPDGKEVTVAGGDYGWIIDTTGLRDQVLEMVRNGESDRIGVPCLQYAQVYNGPYETDWNGRYADVDLSEQHAYLFGDDGEVIWESDCITGEPTPEKETPTGVWSVQAMRTNETLKTYEPGETEPHETEVSYWMPFVGNLDAFHDAWWQPGFGGTMYADGYGSHGCVNLPTDAAAELFGVLQVGDVVVVHW